MGQLVFQATLGGQVNLVGPNTASTFNINVPAVAGNMVTTGDTGTVTNTMCATSVYTAPGTIGSGTPNTGAFTTLSASSTVSGTGFSTYLASPPAIGGTTAAAGTFTTLTGSTSTTTPILKSASSLTFQSNGTTTAMTIDTSQNVGIGTTSPATYGTGLTIYSATGGLNLTDGTGRNGVTAQGNTLFLRADTAGTSGDMRFYVNGNTERARIDSSGNLLVGQTSGSASTLGASIATTDGSNQWRLSVANSGSTNTAYGLSVYSTGAAAYRMYLAMNGQLYCTNTTITGISDQRLKENIRDLDDGLSKILALQPRKFDWKQGKGADTKNARGFIAQEFETVFPDLIDEWKDPAPEGEETYKAVKPDLIPVLVKAIQEQQALITQLQADVAALKAK